MRFTGVRTLENQAALMHHKAREMLVTQRTQLINALRGDAGHPPPPARTMLAYRCRFCTASTAAFTRRSTSWLAAR